jgi:nucleoid DNA-binding protein
MLAKKKISKDLMSKHPNLTKEQIQLILNSFLRMINQKLGQNKVVDLSIPNFGRVHTHGRVKDVSRAKRFKAITKGHNRNNKFSDEALLF